MLGSREYPNNFYIRTNSGNIYHIIQNDSNELNKLLKNDRHRIEYIQENAWSEWLIYNPKTKKLYAIHNNILKLGKEFRYTAGYNTSAIKEIVWVSLSSRGESTKTKVWSTIKEDFKKLRAT